MVRSSRPIGPRTCRRAVELPTSASGVRLDASRPRLVLALDVHGRRDTMRAQYDDRTLGHLGQFLDEDRPARAQLLDDVLVVHDLLAHVDRRSVEIEGLLDGDHCPVHAGAVATGGGQKDGSGCAHVVNASRPQPRADRPFRQGGVIEYSRDRTRTNT